MRSQTVRVALIVLSYASILFTLSGLPQRGLTYWYLFCSPMVLAATFYGLRGAAVCSVAALLGVVTLYERALIGVGGIIPVAAIGAEPAAALFSTPLDSYTHALLGTVLLSAAALVTGYLADRRWVQLGANYSARELVAARIATRPQLNEMVTNAVTSAKRDGGSLAVMMAYVQGINPSGQSLLPDDESKVMGEVMDVLSGYLRGCDCVCRMGPRELGLALVGVNRAQAEAAAKRLLARLPDHEFIVNGRKERFTTSIGVAFFPGSLKTVDGLLQLASETLHQARNWAEGGVYLSWPSNTGQPDAHQNLPGAKSA